MPRVSVLMTIYNPGRFLAPAIDSLLVQTFADFELVAIENGSRDGSKEIMREYARKDARIRFVDLPENIGRTSALNMALQNAQGELVAVLDADDIASRERLAREVAFLDSHPDVVLVASHARSIDDQGAVEGRLEFPCDPAELFDCLAFSNPIAHSSVMYRREKAVTVGGYPARYVFAQDFGLWIALAKIGKIAMIPESLADIRNHGGRMTQAAELAVKRLRELLELSKSALALPGYSARARRLGRWNLASGRVHLAWQLFKLRQPLAALSEVAIAFFSAPIYCLRKACGVMSRRLASRAISGSSI